ncbi:MAG: YbaK/EbsC family protein [Planctomycetes bacterium]|nr:YbaK/EbsC family protein [Planctomycetota bacterium]
MPATKLRRFLDDHQIRYVAIRHSPAYTAQETAASAHIPGREMAKAVIVQVDGTMAMVVMPSTTMLDPDRLRRITGAEVVSLATEGEFRSRFPDCEIGAMPPFGNLYGLDVYVDRSLREDNRIAFNAGSHAELIQMDYGDFERLAEPTVADLAYRTRAGI